jgi:formyltetrahydrofolate-dependent phosphoribosylglycinamide formyltransferase
VRRAAGSHGRHAVFLDRDGTIIEDVAYLRDSEQLRLLPGAADAIKRLNASGFLAIVVTNQSGIARGLLSRNDYLVAERRVDELLAQEGARLDAHYFCPHLPELTGPCECRKPGPLLYRQAAEQFHIDLTRSWWVGDRLRDVLPADALGGRGILVLSGAGQAEAADRKASKFAQARDLAEAVDLILHDCHPERSEGSQALASPAKTMRIAVAISGRGSNLEALLRALQPGAPAEIVLVVSDRADAGGLAHARNGDIPAVVLSDPANAAAWLELLRGYRIDLVVLAGYQRLVPAPVVAAYRGRIINTHPSLLPAFGGKGMYGERVHRAVLESGARETGVTIHLVDEVYDRGAVLAQSRVPVLRDDTAERLAARVLEVEHRLLPAAVLAAAAAGRPVALEESPVASHQSPARVQTPNSRSPGNS